MAVAHFDAAAAYRHTSTWPPPARLTIEAKGIHNPGPSNPSADTGGASIRSLVPLKRAQEKGRPS